MAIKSVEYEHKFHDHLVGGIGFYQVSDHGNGGGDHAFIAGHGDTIKGKKLWDASCRSCHGTHGEGIPGQGTVLNTSTFVQDHSDQELIEFVLVGREAASPDSILNLQMPPKGGNLMLKKPDILDIVTYMRTLVVAPTATSTVQHPSAEVVETASVHEGGDFLSTLPRSTVPHAMASPEGLAPEGAAEAQKMAVYERPKVPQTDEHRPANAHLFFGLYFLMTGLHGIHVLIGMVVIGWLMWRLRRGDFNKQYYAPVECGGLYWHIVDVIWIFLFPLWYLIT